MSLDRIFEGSCPTCGATLERRDDCGWCPICNIGHSLRMHAGEGMHTVHFGIDGGTINTPSGSMSFGHSDVTFTTQVRMEEPGRYEIGATFDETHEWTDVTVEDAAP